MANIQIPERLFVELYKYHCTEAKADASYIEQELKDKLDKTILRTLYTQSKTALTEEDREKARQEYLDKKGIPNSFRW